MPAIRFPRLGSGANLEIQASLHRYVKGRKGADRHGLLLTVREEGAPDPSLELLVDLTYLFDEAEVERLLRLRSDAARDREVDSLLGWDTAEGLSVSIPGLAGQGPFLATGVLEARGAFIDAFSPCRLWCVPGQNTVKLKVLDSAGKEAFVFSLAPGFLRLPGLEQEPMWWGEVTLDPFEVSWEKVQAPSALELFQAALGALASRDSRRRGAEDDQQWASRCGDLVSGAIGRLAWSEPSPPRGDHLERRLVRAVAPGGDRYGLGTARPALVTYQLNLPRPPEGGGMDPDRVARRIQRCLDELSARLFIKGGNKKDRAGDKHARKHSTFYARHPSEMLRRMLALAYTRTRGFDVTPSLCSREVEVSLYELEEYAVTVAKQLKLNWTEEVSQCAKDAIVEAVIKYAGSWRDASADKPGGVVAHIKATVKRRLKDLASPRVHRSLPGGAMAPVITTTLRIMGVPLERAVPPATSVPEESLWEALERAVDTASGEPAGTSLVKLAAAVVAQRVAAEARAHLFEAMQVLEQEVPEDDGLEEWLDRRGHHERAVLDLRARYASPDPGVDAATWERRCLCRWYLDLARGRRLQVRSRLRMSYLSLVLLREIRRAFKQAAARAPNGDLPPARHDLSRDPHLFADWFAGWLVQGQRQIGERLPSADKIDKKLFPLKLFLEGPSEDIQLDRFPVRALKNMAFPPIVFLTMILRKERYPDAAGQCCGMDVQRLIRAANSSRIEMDDHWHGILVQYIHDEPPLYGRAVERLYDQGRTVEQLCEALARRSLELGCLRRGHPFGTEFLAPHSPELVSRMVELAGETAGTRRAEHYWRFADLDMQSEQRVAEAVAAVPWEELRGVLGQDVCRIMDTPRADGSPRTFGDLTATEIFTLSHKLGRKNCWKEERVGA